MKKLLLLVVFVVTWKTYEAEKVMSSIIVFGQDSLSSCRISEKEERKEFSTKTEAQKFAEGVAGNRMNWDVTVWEMEEVK